MFDFLKDARRDSAEYLEFEEEVKKLTAKDAMIRPMLLYDTDDCKTIIKKLKREDTNVCIVINKDKKFIGEIGDNDLIKLFLQQVKFEPLVQILNIGYRREFLYKSAKDMINKHKATVKINTPINKVIELIYKDGFNYIPVLDDKKRVIGVITPSSVIELLKEN
ncbi:MAG: CBS domain-containing protein [Candidatus Nanoarchaeia archaeon]|nr:CBS domain-containing protein [Candidatus Nanoarchaeia archaeon]